VVAILNSGGRVVLTAVTPAQLPALLAAAGGDPVAPAESAKA
jgi:hypothetical protein